MVLVLGRDANFGIIRTDLVVLICDRENARIIPVIVLCGPNPVKLFKTKSRDDLKQQRLFPMALKCHESKKIKSINNVREIGRDTKSQLILKP